LGPSEDESIYSPDTIFGLKNALIAEPIDYFGSSYFRALVVGGPTFFGENPKSPKSFIFVSLSPKVEPTSVFDYLILEFLS
jgi:hypothetical protein